MTQDTQSKMAAIIAAQQAKVKSIVKPIEVKFNQPSTPTPAPVKEADKATVKAPEQAKPTVNPPVIVAPVTPVIKPEVKDVFPEISNFTLDTLFADITPSIEVADIPETETTVTPEVKPDVKEVDQWLNIMQSVTMPVQQATKPNLQIFDYSVKAFAVIGDTEANKHILFQLGGSFNRFLKCGPGWIFSKTRLTAVKERLSI